MTRILLRAAMLACCGLFVPAAVAGDRTEKAGNVVALALPAAALAATVIGEHDRSGTVQLVQSIAASSAATLVLKSAVHSRRPNGDCCDSFPSLHSSVAFGAASFVQRRYGWRYGLPAYGAAAFVAYSRVQSDRHRWGDVAAGAAIGVLGSHLYVAPYRNVNVGPVAGGGYAGVRLTAIW